MEEAAKTDCKILKREVNRLGKIIKKEIENDRTEYFEKKFNDKEDSSNACRTANKLLGTVKNLAPTAIIHTEKEGNPPEMITNPARLAKIFNEFFINKVKKLRAKSRMVPNSDPVLRVRKWLEKRPSPTPIFRIKKIDTEALKIALKGMFLLFSFY